MKKTAQRGFTMVELMVTMVVSLFGIMALLALHVSIAQGTNQASVTQEAINVGNQTIEELRTLRPTDMMLKLTGNAASVPPLTVAPYATIAGRTQSYTVNVSVSQGAGSSGLWLIRATVTWTDDGSSAAHSVPFEVIRTSAEAL